MKRVLSLIVCLMLAFGMMSSMSVFAASDDAYLGTDAASAWYTGTQVIPGESGEYAVKVMPSGEAQTLWASHIQITPWTYMAENGGLTTWRYLHYKTDGKLTKFASAFSYGYDQSKEKDLPTEAGEHVVDIIELAGEDAMKDGQMIDTYWYLVAAATEGSEFEYIYLSTSKDKESGDTPTTTTAPATTTTTTVAATTTTVAVSTSEDDASSEADPVESTSEDDASSEADPVESTFGDDVEDDASSDVTVGDDSADTDIGIIIAIVVGVVVIAGAAVVTFIILKKKSASAADSVENTPEE